MVASEGNIKFSAPLLCLFLQERTRVDQLIPGSNPLLYSIDTSFIYPSKKFNHLSYSIIMITNLYSKNFKVVNYQVYSYKIV